MRYAKPGITTALIAVATKISRRPLPACSGRMPCKDMPKAMRMSGTAAPPMSSNGARTGSGSRTPNRFSTTPVIDATIIGFRKGWVTIPRKDTEPRCLASRIVSAIGAKTRSCSRITGATYPASPRTYTATGMPMLLAFT